jgi:hypothetical protein
MRAGVHRRIQIPLVAALVVSAALVVLPQAAGRLAPTPGLPPRLAGTGLYSDLASKAIGPRNLSYSPQYPLWSDGAQKRRWIQLPPGGWIDASDPDEWVFPPGTRIWKEFSFHGRRVETRFMQSIGAGRWLFASYVWNADESDAVLAPAGGLPGVAEIVPGKRHDIPGVLDCRACHEGNRVEVLGFSALQLSADRDPAAPHAEPLSPGMVNIDTLMLRGLVRRHPRGWLERAPRIPASGPIARAALGYLHANCGNCHSDHGPLASLGFQLRCPVASSTAQEPALSTTVNRSGRFRIPGAAPGDTYLIRPGDPEHSSILFRRGSRNALYQMPPLGTKLADTVAVALVRQLIQEGPPWSGDSLSPER